MKKLSERAEREQVAWDEGSVWAENRNIVRKFSHVFQCPNIKRIEEERNKRFLESIVDKDLLEIGCYTGEAAKNILNARYRSYTGIDISPRAIDTAKKQVGLDTLYVMNAESLEFPDESFDVVFGSAILHHLDWAKAIVGIKRVLRLGGKAFFSEPLGDNPLSKLYRTLTPKARTPDELPVTRRQLRWADQLFSNRNHRFSSFLSTYAGAVTSLFLESENNFILRFCDTADLQIEKTPLRYWMRYAFLEWQK